MPGQPTMTKEQFLEEFSNCLGGEPGEIAEGTQLASLDAWDPVAYLATMVMIDAKLGVAITFETLAAATTVNDIMTAAGSTIQA